MDTELLSHLVWLRHASFLYEGSVRIAFDPWSVSLARPVDLVLVTHAHSDHCDPETVARMTTPSAVIVAGHGSIAKLSGNVRPIRIGQTIEVGDVTVTATHAYNLHQAFHPRGDGLGYLVTVDDGTIFHAGDTDNIPETHGLKPDIALLPVGGKYTMDVPEAVEAALAIGAGVSIPMHYGFITGTRNDGREFVRILGGRRAKYLEPKIPFQVPSGGML